MHNTQNVDVEVQLGFVVAACSTGLIDLGKCEREQCIETMRCTYMK